ncbi:MAG: tRNA (adenosine(37)-N6)-threonylcarbamoyltransferase complex transferase subunit TsaD [Acutalibacteraceae bacterium]
MKILSIESSCDETAAAVVENGRKILSSIVASQVEEHKIYGGVVPEIASRMHIEAISGVTSEALKAANCNLKNINAIAVTYAPGLIGSLLVGVNFAKGLALSSNLPLIPVHHLRSHIAANYITHQDLTPPFLCLVVSGGHSHIIEVKGYADLKVIGRTRDDAAGEAFDKVARTMRMPYPGGVHLDKAAEKGNENVYKLPRPTVSNAEYDFSFSGLKTAVINQIHNAAQKGELINVEDMSASFRAAVVDCLINNFIKAAENFGYKKLVIAGGVSANTLLRKRLSEECKKRNWRVYSPELSLCGDNAAMVGAQAYYEYQNGNVAAMDLNAIATLSIDKLK